MISAMVRGIGGVICVQLLSGCSLLFEPGNAYHSNRPVLDAASAATGYRVDSEIYHLVRLEAERDSVTFHYRGVDDVSAEAWVLRFSPKPSEQTPTALEDLYSHLSLIRELREGFALGDEVSRDMETGTLEFAPYAFSAPNRDAAGRPSVAQGVVAIVRSKLDGHDVVWVVRLERIDDEALGEADLAPFIEAI